jgi:hypothetical protein
MEVVGSGVSLPELEGARQPRRFIHLNENKPDK